MKNDTMNEACKHTKSIKYGGRRRQCIYCKATWRVRAKSRGPKAAKKRIGGLQQTFVEKLTLVQQSHRSRVSSGAFSKRHAQTLTLLAEHPWPHEPPAGHLILVMDAMWFETVEGRQTVYLMGLRAIDDDRLHFLRPILRPESESQKRWREVIGEIHKGVRERICAIVSDSFAGSGGLAKEHGWVFQRC